MQKFFLSLGVAALMGVSVWAFSQWMEVQQTTEDVNKAAEISSRAEKDARHDNEEAKRLSLELEKVENMRQQESLELKETLEEGQELEHPWLNKAVENAQKKVEQRNYLVWKHILEYDDVMNQQR